MRAFHEIRNYGSDFKVWCSTYENISFLSHWHKEMELIYVSAGTCRISVGDQSFTAHGGDLVVCDSGNIHYSDSYEEENTLHFLLFDIGMVQPFYEKVYFLSSHVTKEQLAEFGLSGKLKELFETVERELHGQKKYYQDIVKAKICEFWYLLIRKMPRSSDKNVRFNKRIEQMYDFQEFLSYMEAHLQENITLESAAGQLGFSASHFSRTFKKLTGINFVQYLNMIRVEQAAKQLKNTHKKITEICLDCGFTNIRTFNRVFKEVTGYTPTQFAQNPELELYNPVSYLQKYSQKKYVEQDSMTLIRNVKANMNRQKETV